MIKQNNKLILIIGLIIVIITIIIIGGIKLKNKVDLENKVELEKQEQVQIQEQINKQKELEKQEQENIIIDEYNFNELEKVKNILDNLDKSSYSFKNLKEFNQKFNQDIKSVNNCFFLADRNRFFDDNSGTGGYVFGFKLYSNKYISDYNNWYYVYPKYDLPYSDFCDGSCYDMNESLFLYTISNPCRD